MDGQIKELAGIVKGSKNIVFFGGAGVSTESGVPDYRSKDGLYNTVKEYGVSPEEILSRSFFDGHPDVFYDFYRKYFIITAKPNPAHFALARLEKAGILSTVITQNIDGLHRAAGSRNVIELHGTCEEFFCNSCKEYADAEKTKREISDGGIPRCGKCGGVIRPKVVFYQEPLYKGVPEAAVGAIMEADTLIIGGTSLVVAPANTFVRFYGGKNLVIINRSETPYDERARLVIRERIGVVFDGVMKELEGWL